MKTLKALKADLPARPNALAAYEAQAEESGAARELIAARTRAGLTQADVAQRMGTTQSAIARLEGGRATPSLRSVQRYAHAIGCRAAVRLESSRSAPRAHPEPVSARLGIVLFAHGSRDARWREPVQALARRIAEQAPAVRVRCAYLEWVAPDLQTACAELLAEGVDALHVMPLFLGLGRHLRDDLPALIAQLQQAHPQVPISLRPALGEHPALIELLARIALQAEDERD